MRQVIQELARNRTNYLFLAAAALFTLIFGYFSYPYMVIAFERFDYTRGVASPWVGLEHFRAVFATPVVWEVIRNTIVLNTLFIAFNTVIAIGLALLLNEVRSKWFRKVSQTFMLLPYFLSWVIVSYILFALLNTDSGLVNNVLTALGASPVEWYSKPGLWYPILVLVYVLKNAGYTSIIYLAAITGFDPAVYDAAAVDGAGRWRAMWYVTIPMLRPVIFILTLFAIGQIFFADFAMIYALIHDNSLLYPVADVIDTYVFRTLRVTGDPSYAMAVGLLQSVAGFVLVFGSNALVKKFYPDGALF